METAKIFYNQALEIGGEESAIQQKLTDLADQKKQVEDAQEKVDEAQKGREHVIRVEPEFA